MIGDDLVDLLPDDRKDDLVSLIEICLGHTFYQVRGHEPYLDADRWRMQIDVDERANDLRHAAQNVYDLLHGRGVI